MRGSKQIQSVSRTKMSAGVRKLAESFQELRDKREKVGLVSA